MDGLGSDTNPSRLSPLVGHREGSPPWLSSVRMKKMSNEKNPGWLGYIGDYTTQLCGDSNMPI